jgi:hypothetical protein
MVAVRHKQKEPHLNGFGGRGYNELAEAGTVALMTELSQLGRKTFASGSRLRSGKLGEGPTWRAGSSGTHLELESKFRACRESPGKTSCSDPSDPDAPLHLDEKWDRPKREAVLAVLSPEMAREQPPEKLGISHAAFPEIDTGANSTMAQDSRRKSTSS